MPTPVPGPERGLRRCVGGPLGRRSSRCLGKYGQDSARKQSLPSPFSQVAGQKMNIKIKQLFWSTDRGRTWLCLSHGSGGQRGPRRRRPGGTFRWIGDTLVLLRAGPGSPAESMGSKGPGQLSRLPSAGAGLLTGWRSAPGKEVPGWEGEPLARSCSPAFAGGIFFFFLGQRNRQTRLCLIR